MKFVNKNQFYLESYKMTPDEFFKRRRTQPSPVILDIRPAEVAENSKLDGSHNIPFEELEDRLIQLPPFAHILLYSDENNADIENAVKLLWENGFTEMKYVDGGYGKIIPNYISITDSAKSNFSSSLKDAGVFGFKILVYGQDYSVENIESENDLGNLQAIVDDDLRIYVDPKSFRLLEGTELDFKEGKLVVDHPRMHEPRLEGSLEERVQTLVDQQINPGLAGHGGFVKILEIKNDQLFVELGGGCQGCGMANVTLKNGIEVTITDNIPEITEVIDATDHHGGSNPYYNPA